MTKLTRRPSSLESNLLAPILLLISANPVARAVAKSLIDQGFRVLLADSSWANITAAKTAGLETYYGNPISEHANHHLDLVGTGRMLALSPHENMNVSSLMHYRLELGTNSIFSIQSEAATNSTEHSSGQGNSPFYDGQQKTTAYGG